MANFTADVAWLEDLETELRALGLRAKDIASSLGDIGDSFGGIKSLANKDYPSRIYSVRGAISNAAEGVKTASSRMGRIVESYRQCETEAKNAIVDSVMGSSSERLSDALRNVTESLYEDIEIQQGKGISNSFMMNIVKSYIDEGIGKVEGIDNIVDVIDKRGEGDSVNKGVASLYGIVAGVFGLPSFIPDAMSRGEARNKKAQDWVAKVAKEHGLGWGVAATVPAALWELGDFLCAELPHCAAFTVSHLVKKQVVAATEVTTRAKNLNALMGPRISVQPSSGITNFLKANAAYEGAKDVVDALWRGFTGEKLPGYVDLVQAGVDQGVSRVTSRLIGAAREVSGGESGGSR